MGKKAEKISDAARTLSHSRFESISSFVPKKTITTDEIMSRVKIYPTYKLKHVPLVGKIMAGTKLRHFLHEKIDLESLVGVKSRHQCSKDEDCYTMALAAAENCLKDSNYNAEDMEVIINCSISKYKNGLTYVYEPPMSVYLKDSLGAKNALNFDISNACAGMMTGVFILDDMIKNGVVKKGMVVSAEYTSYLFENAAPKVKTIASPELASLTTGDGAAAVIMEASAGNKQGMKITPYTTLAEYSDLCFGKPGKNTPGSQMTTKARKIHKVAIANAPLVMAKALKAAGFKYKDMDYVIPHQTSSRAMKMGGDRIAKELGGGPEEGMFNNITNYGNTASTTHFIALSRMLREKILKKGEKVMLLVFASGLVIGVLIFEMDDLVEKYGRSC